MAVNSYNITSGANFIPEIWDTENGDAVQANIVLADLVDRTWDNVMSMGDQVHIVDVSNPAVRVKATDTNGTYSNRTETMQTITITLNAYVGFLVEDILELQAQTSVRQKYTKNAGYSLAAYIEGDATNGLASLPNGFSQVVGNLGVDPSDDDFIRAEQYLNDANAPQSGRFLYITPAIKAAMLKLNKFTNSDFVGSDAAMQAVKEAHVGRAYGADVFVSSLANNNPSAANQGYGWFCHKRGVALIMQQNPVTHVQYDLLQFGWGVMINTIYAFAERLVEPATLGGGTSDDTQNCAIAGA